MKVEEAILEAFIQTDEKLRKDKPLDDGKVWSHEGSGCTVSCILMTPEHMFFVNAGDSRSIHVRYDPEMIQPSQYFASRETVSRPKEVPKGQRFVTLDYLDGTKPHPIPKVTEQTMKLANDEDKKMDDGSKKLENEMNKEGFKLYFATRDHKPDDDDEKTRIQEAGGSVSIGRVNGSLAVSRGFGDFTFKNVVRDRVRDKDIALDKLTAKLRDYPEKQMVSVIPDITCVDRVNKNNRVSAINDQFCDAFTIVACDGIWDVMSNQELTEYVAYRLALLKNEPTTEDLRELADGILQICLHKGSRDNMSLIIITYDSFHKVLWPTEFTEAPMGSLNRQAKNRSKSTSRSTISNSAKKKFEERRTNEDKTIEKLKCDMEQIMSRIPDGDMTVEVVMRYLDSTKFEVPGAGMSGRRPEIEKIYSELNPCQFDDDNFLDDVYCPEDDPYADIFGEITVNS